MQVYKMFMSPPCLDCPMLKGVLIDFPATCTTFLFLCFFLLCFLFILLTFVDSCKRINTMMKRKQESSLVVVVVVVVFFLCVVYILFMFSRVFIPLLFYKYSFFLSLRLTMIQKKQKKCYGVSISTRKKEGSNNSTSIRIQ